MKGGVRLYTTWQYMSEELTLMKGGVRLYTTWQYIRKELTLMKGGLRLYTTWQNIRKELTLSFAASGCSCVRSPMRFLNLWLQIAMEWLLHCLPWLHECCMACDILWLWSRKLEKLEYSKVSKDLRLRLRRLLFFSRCCVGVMSRGKSGRARACGTDRVRTDTADPVISGWPSDSHTL